MQNAPRLTEQHLQTAKSLACDECGHKVFVNVFVLKHISALASPTGQEINAPVPTFACAKCSHVNAAFMPPGE